jgi:hypothetical protein
MHSACSSLKAKAERAKARGHVRVFLSHKQKDYNAAKVIHEIFELKSAEKIKVFLSENIEKGDDWQEQIERELHDSDWFVFLFSGTEDDWAWCNHEAGVFRGMMYPEPHRLVVLYPGNVQLPNPLKQYQPVKCEPAQRGQPHELDEFLKQIFGQPPYPGIDPINRKFAQEAHEERAEATRRIIDAVGRLVINSIEQDYVLHVHIPDASRLVDSAFPEGTTIRRGSTALQLFQIGNGAFLWDHFLAKLDHELNRSTMKCFWPAVYSACFNSLDKNRIFPTHTVFRSPEDGRHYLPVLNRVEITGDNSANISMSFVQVAAGTQTEVRDESVARIFTALNLSHRFRWEIIDRYRNPGALQAFVEQRRKEAVGEPLMEVWDMIRLIEEESQKRGVYDPQALPADFGPEATSRVGAMFPNWWQQRYFLEQAAKAGDVATFALVLAELDPINVEFISLASKRLGELVRADAHMSARQQPPALTRAA